MLKKGGNLRHEIFSKILSIGYELETTNLSKLTLLPNSKILLNTDVTSEFYGYITNEPIDLDTDDIYKLRRNEKVEYEVYTSESLKNSTLQVDRNSKFLVTNDIADNKLTKYLTKLCDKEEKKIIKDTLKYSKEDEEEDEEYDEDEEYHEDDYDEDDIYEIAKEFKNDLYSFHLSSLNGNETYKINFETSNKKECGIFSGTEWIFTYYKPNVGKNIILDTFVNVIKNLKYHFDNLLLLGDGELEMSLNDKKTEKSIIPNPERRKLFNYPETNMYYLQSHFIDEEQTIDDVCLVPQMTFACKASDVIDISKELIRDTLKIFKDYFSLAGRCLDIIERIELCIEELFFDYNKKMSREEKMNEEREPELLKLIKSYLFLLLFKLHQYYNSYLPDPKIKAKYLKNTLFINSRHSNYALYLEIKKSMKLYFPSFSEKKIINTIHKLIINEEILSVFLVYDPKFVRKGAFKFTNKLNKTNKNYGDPHYSFISYLEYFENPLKSVHGENEDSKEDENEDSKELSIKTLERNHDWLKYNGIDVFSSVMEIKDNIILIEIRSFAHIISNFVASIADEILFNEILTGSCSRILKKESFNLASFTLKSLYMFADLYDKLEYDKFITKKGGKISKKCLKNKIKKRKTRRT